MIYIHYLSMWTSVIIFIRYPFIYDQNNSLYFLHSWWQFFYYFCFSGKKLLFCFSVILICPSFLMETFFEHSILVWPSFVYYFKYVILYQILWSLNILYVQFVILFLILYIFVVFPFNIVIIMNPDRDKFHLTFWELTVLYGYVG